nr:MAG TPA: hypothetical protein [Caudoviricetes sp.]DAY65039.1 MAG TPA: hypothetical protein [Caudoviricetes sp.]
MLDRYFSDKINKFLSIGLKYMDHLTLTKS